MLQRIAQTSVALILITAVTAATGYLREVMLARTFGAGTEMDAFYFTVALVQACQDLLFGATLTATIVPLLHRPDNGEPGTTYDPARFTLTVALTVALLAGALALLLRAALPYLIDVLSPAMSSTSRAQCLALSTVLVLLLPLNALTNLCALVHNAHHRFILPATVYIFSNLVFVGVVLLRGPAAGLSTLSIAAVAGPACFLPILAASLARLGLLRPLRPDFSRKFFAPFWRQARPILLTLGIGSSSGLLMIAHLFVRGFAASSSHGSIAALGYAFRLYEVPLSLLANPAAVLILPNVAVLYKAGRAVDIGEVGRQTLLAGLVVLFPAAIVTWMGADLIVHVLLQRGNFDAAAAQLTANALRGFAPAIVGEGIIVVFYRFFYAVHRPSRPVAVSGAVIVALLSLLFLFGNISFIAVPLALSGGFLVGALILVYFLAREIGAASLPNPISIARWAACALIGVAAWRLAARYETPDVWSETIPVGAFTLIYGAAILAAFADYRRMLRGMIGAFALRLRQLLALA